MVRIHPFTAVRPQPNLVPAVASVPYDVVSTEEARQLADGHSKSFLHVVRSEIDLPEGTDPHDDAVYAKARENFDRFLESGTLMRDERPAMYVYRLALHHHTQMGLVCCCHIDDYAHNLVKRHERTRRTKEDDRTRHVLEVNANTGPVFCTYRADPRIAGLFAEAANDRPLFHFDAPDGVTHTAWKVEDHQPLVDAFAAMDAVYVADGHHRAASAYRAGLERRAANPDHRGDEEYNWFLVTLFPADQLTILPYNRVVRDTAGKTANDLLTALQKVVHVSGAGSPDPPRPGSFCMYLQGKWYLLEIDADTIDFDHPIESLDAALLQSRILEPILGAGDPRTDERLDFVGGIRGTEELERLVDSGRAAVAFSMYATSIDQLLAVADADLVMPPKSTWFEPKLRSGLFVHTLD
jgi:uncharacterized protein (DUF1015 family)